MPYIDLNTIHNPVTGTVAPAAWGDQVRENLEFLVDTPSVYAYNSVDQSVSDLTTTLLNADSETYDNDSMHSTVTNTSRFTAQTEGRYLFIASVRYAVSGGTYRSVYYSVNGGAAILVAQIPPAGGSGVYTHVLASASVVLVPGDYLEFHARHNSGGSLATRLNHCYVKWITR